MSYLKIRLLIISILFICGSVLFYSQDKKQNNEGNKKEEVYYHIADSLWHIAKYDSSNLYFKKAASIFRRNLNWNKFVDCYWNIGVNNGYLEKYDSALYYLEKAIKITKQKIADKDSVLINIYNSKGVIFYSLGNYENAFKFYKMTLEMSRKIFGDESVITAKGFHNVGLIYYKWGDLGKAKEYFKKALSIWLKNLGSKSRLIAYCYTNIANVLYYEGDVEKAVIYDEKALKIWKDKLGENHPFVAYSYNNLSSSYQYLGKLNKALSLEKKSLAIRLHQVKEKRYIAKSLFNIGSIYTDMKQFDSAYVYLNRSRKLLRSAKYKNHVTIATNYVKLAELFLKQNFYSKSINYYDSALTFTYKKILSVNSPDEVNYRQMPRDNIFITAIIEKAAAYYEKYLNFSHNKNDLLKSLLNYQIASRASDYSRSEYFRDESKFQLSKKLSDINGKGLETAFRLYTTTQDNYYKKIAFEFAERNKARILFEAINESEAEKYSNIPDSLLTLEKNIKSRMSFYISKLQDAEEDNDSSSAAEIENNIFEVQERYDRLKKIFEKKYPKYHDLKYKKNVVKVSNLQKVIKKNDAILEYYIFKNKLYVFTITENNFYIDRIMSKYPINDLVKSFRSSLLNLDFKGYLEAAYNLYNILIKPCRYYLEDVSKIYIIPDGILNYLPFEALLSKKIKQQTPDFSRLPYLIKKYIISYQFSSSLLAKAKLHSKEINKDEFIGIAPVFDANKKGINRINSLNNSLLISQNSSRSITVGIKKYSALPETEKEVEGITNLFLNKNKHAEYFLRDRAKEDLLKSDKIRKYNFIHLATHGFINEQKPKLSGILFTNEEKKEDGILYANEIYNLNLNADLVVLSACESGLGKIVNGEGIISLTRGLLFAGAKNVIVSLWQVADRSTSQLMLELYKKILNGKSFASALRQSKLKLIENRKYSYPLEWGPFILVGD